MNTAVRQDNCVPLLTDIALFQGLTGEQLRFIGTDCCRKRANKGLILCEKGVRLDGFYAVRQGRIKLAMLSAEGAERVVQIALPGETFGEGVGLAGHALPFYAQALTEAELLFFRAEHIKAAVARWPALAMLLLDQACARMQELYHDLEACCLQSALQRVAGYLQDRLDCLRDQHPSAPARIALPAGKAVVASRLNLTPETFSRELRQLSAAGIIRVDKGLVQILDQGRLADATGRG
mgnify:CR=1 FL=1